jgi:hypothetical protein
VVASSAIPTSQVSSSAVPSSAAPSSSAAPPTETGVALHPNGNAAKCLDVKEANFADGAYVQM